MPKFRPLALALLCAALAAPAAMAVAPSATPSTTSPKTSAKKPGAKSAKKKTAKSSTTAKPAAESAATETKSSTVTKSSDGDAAVASAKSADKPAEKAAAPEGKTETKKESSKKESPKNEGPKDSPKPPFVGQKVSTRVPKPENVHGIYLTAWSAGNKRLDQLLELRDRTEINSFVIDVRDDGDIYFKNDIKTAIEGKASNVAVAHPDQLFEKLAQHKVYAIARIACFRDNNLQKTIPSRCVQNRDGTPWHDRSKHYWLDPYNRDNWEYMAQIADLAIDLGFAEIQLDYVRFPSEGKRASMLFPSKDKYPQKDPSDSEVIKAFGHFMRDRVKARGAAFSADIFGIVSSGKQDQGIGQALEQVAEPFDLVCPMVYPSHYHKMEYGIADPNKDPYNIVFKSLRDYRKRLPEKHIRPWLQDFTLYGVHYGKDEVQAQIKAAREHGYMEYLLWNAGNKYTEAAVTDTSHLNPKAAASAK